MDEMASPLRIEFLKKVPIFASLPDVELERLAESVVEVSLETGEMLFAQDDPGDSAYIIREGELEIVKLADGRELLLAVTKSGEVVGEMALLEEAPRSASVRARTPTRLYAIHKEEFDKLINSSTAAMEAVFQTMLIRLREDQAQLRQSEKMVQLGTLTAGVAHELNNPAASVKRGASQLSEAITKLNQSYAAIFQLSFNELQEQTLEMLAGMAESQAAAPMEMDAVTRSDREGKLEGKLESIGVENPWELTLSLVQLNFDEERIDMLAENFSGKQLVKVVEWLDAIFTTYTLLKEIEEGSTRISGIVKALKSYSYLDQAPVQAVDVNQGLDDTLMVLRNKIKEGISIKREYSSELPRIQAYGSELNQVWTNIIDNAIDALDKKGIITLRTRGEGNWVVVEIEDNGSGIPPEDQSKIFDAFFTTKGPGKGTGLGLDISYRIVANRHRGDIRLFSEPGRTRFEVWLPQNFEAIPEEKEKTQADL